MLLETLLDAGGQPVSKEVLLSRAWPEATVEEGNLTVQISALRRQLGDQGSAVIVTVPGVGYRLVIQGASVNDAATTFGALAVLAVLPFANLGPAAGDGYFADGVVEDIVTALSRFKTFAVLSRPAGFALGSTAGEARTAAADLGIRYALAGSIRRMGHRLRVTAQLLEASTGRQLWADRYEGGNEQVFSFQDSIAECVVGIVEPTIRKAEIERVRRKPAGSLAAYELLRGNNEAAIQWCQRSLATFNDWPFTYITLVAAYSNLGRLDEARAMLRRVLELSPHLTMKIVEDHVAKVDAFADAVIHGLRNAGLPER